MISKEILISDEAIQLFGINFLRGDYSKVINLLSKGGFMIVPSAPSLSLIQSDQNYCNSLQESDFAIPDSGLMILILKLFYGIELQKLSGLAFLNSFFMDCVKNKNAEIFLVEASVDDHVANEGYFNKIGLDYNPAYYYIAPIYKDIVVEDYDLLKQLEAQKPHYIIINLGGGIQEKLGYFLKKNLTYKPAIICTGAAIAFLSGQQANIPDWGDRLYLGWLFRCLSNPRRFVPRYLSSIKLIFMLMGCSVEASKKHDL